MKHSKPVQVNFTADQKKTLDEASAKAGVPLAVWLRMAALSQTGAVAAACAEAKRALSDPQLVAIARGPVSVVEETAQAVAELAAFKKKYKHLRGLVELIGTAGAVRK